MRSQSAACNTPVGQTVCFVGTESSHSCEVHTPSHNMTVPGVCRRPSRNSPRPSAYTQGAGEPLAPSGVPQAEGPATTKPAYYRNDDDWPECVGKCLDGHCALPWHHPECCYVPFRDEHDQVDGYSVNTVDVPTQMTVQISADAQTASVSGFWRSHDLFCPSLQRRPANN